ncbi:MAG: serine hydrolase [Flavisolibacter sp.]
MRMFFLSLFLVPLSLFAQDLAVKADALLQAYHQQDQFSGTVLIAKSGKIVFEKSYGEADREKHIPNQSSTEYRIGSVSKPFTAVLIMQLHEKGLLSLQDPIMKWIPGYPKGDSISLENLLNHTSGIKSLTSMKQYYAQWIKETATLDETIGRFSNEPLQFSPGTKFQYSNSNYILLSRIAELATGKTFNQLLQQHIFYPAGMQQSGLDQNGRSSVNKAIGYDAAPETDYAIARYNDMSIMSGAGSIYSTAQDLYKFDRALKGERLISKNSKKQMFTPGLNQYRLGWEIDTVRGRLQVSHSGSIDGYLSNIIRYEAEDICIIFLSNYFKSKGAQISRALTAMVFDEPFEMPVIRNLIELPENQLKEYLGSYQMEKGPAMMVFLEDGKLKGRLGEQAAFRMQAQSQNQFYIKVIDTDVDFQLNEKGEMEMFLKQGSKTMRFIRNND